MYSKGKKTLFTNDIVVDIEYTKNLQINYRVRINKIAKYKVKIQKSMFIYINYNQYMKFFKDTICHNIKENQMPRNQFNK